MERGRESFRRERVFENFEKWVPKQKTKAKFHLFPSSRASLTNSSILDSFLPLSKEEYKRYTFIALLKKESEKRDDGVWRRRRRDDGTNANAALFEYSSSPFSLDDDDKNGQREERTTKTETGYKIHGLGEFQVLRGGTTRRSVP